MNFLKKDEKELARIERRRRFEEERKKRIFDTKFRVIGVDVGALDKQLLEKRKQQEQEEQELRRYAARKLQEDRMVLAIDKARDEERRRLERELIEFRAQYQKPRDRREFDLNDPEVLQKSNMAMVTRFEGEEGTQRFGLLKEQSKAWLLQQMHEKKEKEKQERDSALRFRNNVIAIDQRAQKLAQMENICQQRLNETIAEYNQIVAAEKAAERRRAAEEEHRTNMQEIYNWSTGDFLTENPAQANSRILGKVIAFKYRGEPPEQQKITQQFQALQIQEKKMAAQKEAEKTREWEQYEKNVNSQVAIVKKEITKNQKELEEKIKSDNSVLAQHHRLREAENNDISELRPQPSFFEQFNRSTY